MMKKYIGITVVAASMLVMGCSSNDDSADPVASTDSGETTDGDTTETADGSTDTDGGTETEGEATDGMSNTGEMTFVEATEDYGNTVMGIIAAQPDTTLFESAVLQAEDSLDVTLHDASQMWTVFVPNDTAMNGVFADRDVLLKHIHSGFADADFLTTQIGQEIGMTGGPRRVITLSDDGVTLQISGVDIVQSSIVGDNGVVHKIDGVLQ